jgi:hypothetical protein
MNRGDFRALHSARDTVLQWRKATDDLEQAVRMAPNDDAAWAHLALGHLLLAAAGLPLRLGTRSKHVARAVEAYDACLATLSVEREHERPSVEINRSRARGVAERIARLPWWNRLAGFAGEVSLDPAE